MSDKVNPADMPVWKVLVTVGLQTFAFTAIGAAIWVLSGRLRRDFVTFEAWEVLSGLGLATGLIATSLALASAFPRYADWLVRSQAKNYAFLKHRISMSAIIFISICAGLGEEALFRGGLQSVFGDYMPTALATALASALFAAIHFAKPLNSALIFVIGCIFGAIYWSTGSLLTVIIGHAVYDIYAIWALQEAFHRLGVFEPAEDAHLQDTAAHETLTAKAETTGEDS